MSKNHLKEYVGFLLLCFNEEFYLPKHFNALQLIPLSTCHSLILSCRNCRNYELIYSCLWSSLILSLTYDKLCMLY